MMSTEKEPDYAGIAERLAVGAISPEDVKCAEGGFYYKVLCHECGWFGSSQDCGGGLPMGGDDYTDIECPCCESTCCEEPSELDIMALRNSYASCMEARLRSDWETIRLLQYWIANTHRSGETQNALVAHLSKLLEPFTP